MNKESIEKRLAELRKLLDQTQANGNAIVGAMQECNYWLAQIEKEQRMKIRLLKDTVLEDGKHKAGETLEVIGEIARQLLATGSAELPGAIPQPVIEHVIEKLEKLPEPEPIKKVRKHAG